MVVLGKGKAKTSTSKLAAPVPVLFPSRKSENQGLDPNVNLVPVGSAGWGKQTIEEQSEHKTTVVQESITITKTEVAKPWQTDKINEGGSSTLQSAGSLPGQTLDRAEQAKERGLKWGRDEFPSLRLGESSNVNGGIRLNTDDKYGPGPNLRPAVPSPDPDDSKTRRHEDYVRPLDRRDRREDRFYPREMDLREREYSHDRYGRYSTQRSYQRDRSYNHSRDHFMEYEREREREREMEFSKYKSLGESELQWADAHDDDPMDYSRPLIFEDTMREHEPQDRRMESEERKVRILSKTDTNDIKEQSVSNQDTKETPKTSTNSQQKAAQPQDQPHHSPHHPAHHPPHHPPHPERNHQAQSHSHTQAHPQSQPSQPETKPSATKSQSDVDAPAKPQPEETYSQPPSNAFPSRRNRQEDSAKAIPVRVEMKEVIKIKQREHEEVRAEQKIDKKADENTSKTNVGEARFQPKHKHPKSKGTSAKYVVKYVQKESSSHGNKEQVPTESNTEETATTTVTSEKTVERAATPQKETVAEITPAPPSQPVIHRFPEKKPKPAQKKPALKYVEKKPKAEVQPEKQPSEVPLSAAPIEQPQETIGPKATNRSARLGTKQAKRPTKLVQVYLPKAQSAAPESHSVEKDDQPREKSPKSSSKLSTPPVAYDSIPPLQAGVVIISEEQSGIDHQDSSEGFIEIRSKRKEREQKRKEKGGKGGKGKEKTKERAKKRIESPKSNEGTQEQRIPVVSQAKPLAEPSESVPAWKTTAAPRVSLTQIQLEEAQKGTAPLKKTEQSRAKDPKSGKPLEGKDQSKRESRPDVQSKVDVPQVRVAWEAKPNEHKKDALDSKVPVVSVAVPKKIANGNVRPHESSKFKETGPKPEIGKTEIPTKPVNKPEVSKTLGTLPVGRPIVNADILAANPQARWNQQLDQGFFPSGQAYTNIFPPNPLPSPLLVYSFPQVAPMGFGTVPATGHFVRPLPRQGDSIFSMEDAAIPKFANPHWTPSEPASIPLAEYQQSRLLKAKQAPKQVEHEKPRKAQASRRLHDKPKEKAYVKRHEKTDKSRANVQKLVYVPKSNHTA